MVTDHESETVSDRGLTVQVVAAGDWLSRT